MSHHLHCLDDILVFEKYIFIEIILNLVHKSHNLGSTILIGDFKDKKQPIFPPLNRLSHNKIGPLHQQIHVSSLNKPLDPHPSKHPPQEPIENFKASQLNQFTKDHFKGIFVRHQAGGLEG